MAENRLGQQTLVFRSEPALLASAAIVGPKEGQGPLAEFYDVVTEDSLLGEKSWELAEARMLREAAELAVKKADLKLSDIDLFLAGDLLNQIISAGFVARDVNIPFLGLYGACSTMAESLTLAAILVDGGFADRALAAASSHFETAERQYRFPLEFGAQRNPSAQRTATGAGAAVVAAGGKGPTITHATVGRVVDMGLKDPTDLGGAMAPAAVDTIAQHFRDTGFKPEDYDLIVTGDLAKVGKAVCEELLKRAGLHIADRYNDCGLMLYDHGQDTHAGGSGCACSGVVLCGYLLREMLAGKYRRLLLVGTGALFSPGTYQQNRTIPCIAHAVSIMAPDVVEEA